MALREILTFPNPKLREISVPIKEFTPDLKTLGEDMIETMYHAKGIGLAAPQIGETIRELGLEGQNEKAGTPTMGGLIMGSIRWQKNILTIIHLRIFTAKRIF